MKMIWVVEGAACPFFNTKRMIGRMGRFEQDRFQVNYISMMASIILLMANIVVF